MRGPIEITLIQQRERPRRHFFQVTPSLIWATSDRKAQLGTRLTLLLRLCPSKYKTKDMSPKVGPYVSQALGGGQHAVCQVHQSLKKSFGICQVCNIQSQLPKGSKYAPPTQRTVLEPRTCFFFWSFRNRGLGGPRYIYIYIYIHIDWASVLTAHGNQCAARVRKPWFRCGLKIPDSVTLHRVFLGNPTQRRAPGRGWGGDPIPCF